MKVFITGVAGFIGSNLAKKLLELNHDVIGIDNFSYGDIKNISDLILNKNFDFIQGDVCNKSLIISVKADILVHLSSQKIPRYDTALRTLDENKMMLDNVLNKCINDKIKLVFASTSDVYGKNTELPYSEKSNLVLGPTTVKRWAYAISKIYGEQLIIASSQQYNINYSIARFFGAYGYNQHLSWWGGAQSEFITKALMKQIIEVHGDGKQTRTFTFIDDNIAQLLFLILNEKSNNEIFNISTHSEEEISIIELANLIWKLVNKDDIKIKHIPYSNFGDYEDVMRRVPNIDKILNYSGVKPKVKLMDGLIKTIEWQKNRMNL